MINLYQMRSCCTTHHNFRHKFWIIFTSPVESRGTCCQIGPMIPNSLIFYELTCSVCTRVHAGFKPTKFVKLFSVLHFLITCLQWGYHLREVAESQILEANSNILPPLLPAASPGSTVRSSDHSTILPSRSQIHTHIPTINVIRKMSWN